MQKPVFITCAGLAAGVLVLGTLLGLSPLAAAPAAAADMADPDSFGPALSREAAKPIAPRRHKAMKAKTPARTQASFSMGDAVRHALDFNPTLAADEATARASEEGRKASLGPLFPGLSTSYGYTFSRRKSSPSSGSSTPERGTFTWSVTVSQLIFDGMKTLGTYQKQALQAESDRAALRQSELDTTAQVQSTFISHLCALENVRSRREAVARLRDQLDITRAYNEVGLRPRLDVLQAQVDLGEAESELITADNERQTTQASLNALLGLPVTDVVSYQGTLATPAFTLSLDECLNRASRLRPDLYVGYKAVEMAVKDRLVARAGYYPQVEAYYQITNSGNTADMQRAGSNSSRYTSWEAGATLSWEVFQWGTTYFSDQQAGWLVARARSQARALMLDAGRDVKEKFLALREASQVIKVARETVAHAREAYDAALGQYREQVGTNFDVLDASSNLLSAEVKLTQAKGDYLTALSSLYAAIGEYHPDLR